MDANGGRGKGEREDADSEVAYIARSKRDVAEHFGVAWSTMQPRLVGKIGAKVRSCCSTLDSTRGSHLTTGVRKDVDHSERKIPWWILLQSRVPELG